MGTARAPVFGSGRCPAAGDFVRVVAVYLCLVLALQGFAAASALGAGPLHRHQSQDTPDPIAALVFSHHGHQHLSNERHHHAADDASVQFATASDETVDLAAFALTAALALLAINLGRQHAELRRHVLRAAPGWVCASARTHRLFKPPRGT